MKITTTIVKILTALAAVAGVVYVIATYGDKIVAWAKKLLKCGCCEDKAEGCCCKEVPECEETPCECEAACECEDTEEAPAEEEASAAEEAPAEEAVQAEESDFAE